MREVSFLLFVWYGKVIKCRTGSIEWLHLNSDFSISSWVPDRSAACSRHSTIRCSIRYEMWDGVGMSNEMYTRVLPSNPRIRMLEG
jgi:hypothetical protein